MNDAVKTIALSERKRISVYYDENPDNPLEGLEDTVSVYVVKQNSKYQGPDEGKNTLALDINVALDSQDGVDSLFKRLGIPYRRAKVSVYRDWVGEYIFYLEDPATDEALLEDVVQDYQSYANGEVYQLAYETLVMWTDPLGRKKDEWEVVEIAGGFYIDPYDEEDVLFQAKQSLNIEDERPKNKEDWLSLLKATYPSAISREDDSFTSKINNSSVTLYTYFMSFFASGLTFRLDYEDVKRIEPAMGAFRTTAIETKRNGVVTFTL